MEPKVPEDIYKSHLEPTSKCILMNINFFFDINMKCVFSWILGQYPTEDFFSLDLMNLLVIQWITY